MGIKRKLTSGIICLTVAFAGVVSMPAAANSNTATTRECHSQNGIVAGLWEGVNAALGTQYDCNGNMKTSGNETSGSSNNGFTMQSGGYVALGDSVAAGLGLPLASGGEPACGVSTQSYPAYVASALQQQYRNVACSGATAGDLFTDQRLNGTNREVGPQLNAAFAGGIPSLITVTAGANDTQWQYFVRKCYVSTCGTTTDRVITSGLLTTLQLKLEYALSDINSRSNGQPPQVILTGYYEPFSAACAQQQSNITAGELAWLNSQTQAINQTIASTASRYSFVRYAPVSFSGHELCSADPWVQGLSDAAPFHPTAQGQWVIAQSVLAQMSR